MKDTDTEELLSIELIDGKLSVRLGRDITPENIEEKMLAIYTQMHDATEIYSGRSMTMLSSLLQISTVSLLALMASRDEMAGSVEKFVNACGQAFDRNRSLYGDCGRERRPDVTATVVIPQGAVCS